MNYNIRNCFDFKKLELLKFFPIFIKNIKILNFHQCFFIINNILIIIILLLLLLMLLLLLILKYY